MSDKVYKGYTAQQLDQQYNNRAAVPNHEEYIERWKLDSEQARRQLGVKENIAYGAGERETLDVFPAQIRNVPVVVFIHGGYWQALDKSYFSFVAPPLLQHGFTVVVLNYPLCPAVSLQDIVRSLRWALVYLYRNIGRYNGNAEQMHLVGHSAGGHLAAMLLATPWSQLDSALGNALIRDALSISGLFELEPLRHTYVNQALKLDQTACNLLSPINLPPPISGNMDLFVGGEESAEYKRQSKQLQRIWSRPQFRLRYQTLDGHNHFSILDEMIRSQGKIFTCISARHG